GEIDLFVLFDDLEFAVVVAEFKIVDIDVKVQVAVGNLVGRGFADLQSFRKAVLQMAVLSILAVLGTGLNTVRADGRVKYIDLARTAVILADRHLDRSFGCDHRFDVQSCHELDIVHGENVRRVGHRKRERRTDLRNRQDGVFERDVLGNKLNYGFVDLEK